LFLAASERPVEHLLKQVDIFTFTHSHLLSFLSRHFDAAAIRRTTCRFSLRFLSLAGTNFFFLSVFFLLGEALVLVKLLLPLL